MTNQPQRADSGLRTCFEAFDRDSQLHALLLPAGKLREHSVCHFPIYLRCLILEQAEEDFRSFLFILSALARSLLAPDPERGALYISTHWYRQQYQPFVSVFILRTVTDIHEFNLTVYLLAATFVKGCNKPTEKLSAALPHTLSQTLL